MIRVGNQSAFSAYPLTQPFEFALHHGFDAFEWFPDKHSDGSGWIPADLSPRQRQELRSRARDAGISLTVHAPIHVDPLRTATHRDFEESLRLAVDLGAGLLNIHLIDPLRLEEFAQAVLPWIQRCSIAGVKLTVENLPAIAPEDINRLFTLIPRHGLGFCFDLGHANLHPSTRNDYIAFIDRLAQGVPIQHLHLHENYGDEDSHLVLFSGPAGENDQGLIALWKRLQERHFSGTAILEQWPSPPEKLTQARDQFLDLIRRSSA